MNSDDEIKIIDLNWFTGWVWKDEYFERLSGWSLFETVKLDNSINFLEKKAFGKEIYTY